MGIYRNLKGIIGDTFRIGRLGPILRGVSHYLDVRIPDNSDLAYIRVGGTMSRRIIHTSIVVADGSVMVVRDPTIPPVVTITLGGDAELTVL